MFDIDRAFCMQRRLVRTADVFVQQRKRLSEEGFIQGAVRRSTRHHVARGRGYCKPSDRDELNVWRTVNVRGSDDPPDKIDCGNHHAIVYARQP